MKVIALIPAAGMGKRMGAGVNKQYLQVGGRPILAHTLQVFESAPFVDQVYLVTPADEIAYCRQEVVVRYAAVSATTSPGAGGGNSPSA
jgi:2-C-methyl-D-erythritol 4-phosphate cytidylyltransferase